MVDLLNEYADVSGPKGNESIDLLAEYPEVPSANPQADALALAKQQIAQRYPNMPEFLRDAILSAIPKDKSPRLERAANAAQQATRAIPQVAGGLLQGASLPIRGVSGLIPTDFTQRLSKSPDLRSLFPAAQGDADEASQLLGELMGGGLGFGKLLQGAKALGTATKLPNKLIAPFGLVAAGAAGTPGDEVDRLLGGTAALAGGGVAKYGSRAAERLPEVWKGLMSEATPDKLVQAIQKPHDALKRTADKFYNKVRSLVNEREVKVPLKEEFIEEAKQYFPKTKSSYQDLFERAKKGDYDAIHDIQSALYSKGTKQLGGADLATENEGEAIMDLRDRINDHLHQELLKGGNLDIAHILAQGKKAHAKLQNTYFPKHLRKSVGNMVNPDLRLVPENVQNIFKENSVPMRRFLEQHPEAIEQLEGLQNKEHARNALKNALITLGLGGGATAGIGEAYRWLK